MAKEFCTAGPVQRDIHYAIPPIDRIDRDEVFALIDARKYFILHAPRQTGKTSCLLAIVDELNVTGKYRALYVNIEPAQTARDDVRSAMRTIVGLLALAARIHLRDRFIDTIRKQVSEEYDPNSMLRETLALWAANDPKPICLMIDEVDALVGDSLIAVLRQIRSGYADRPANFPQSIVLCGVRDVRDYRIHGAKEVITGGSAFNIKSESLRLGDFTEEHVRRLYAQHTAETAQAFEDDIFPLVWDLTRGQPWLVNALAYEACFRMPAGRDRSQPVTREIIEQAKENLIIRRDTHLDQLIDKLREPRVRRIIQPILDGDERVAAADTGDDAQYAIDLGLVRRTRAGLDISNEIYREVIPRELNFEIQSDFGNFQRPEWYIVESGRIDMNKLMEGFQQFYREHSEIWLRRFLYEGSGPQLLLQAFLQRIINGGGRIDREYGLGRRRTDLLAVWKYPGGVQRTVIEIKMLRKGLERTIQEGLAQTADYMDRVGTSEAHLVVFDRSTGAAWETRIFRREENFQGRVITVWGM